MSTAASTAVHGNPFPGLRPFREDEEYLFFGRENQVDAMVNKLAATHFLAVVGTSGSGKSSLVNCGLRLALRRGLMAPAGTAWRMAQFRPGSEPLRAMARALAGDGVLFRDFQCEGMTLAEIVDTTLRMSRVGLIDIYEQAKLGENVNLLVVVDQFEELFRYRQLGAAQQENVYGVSDEAIAFVNLLLEVRNQTTHPIYVVLTMRSDFLGDCAQFSGLVEAVNAGQYLVPRMTRDERRAAISGPVGVGGAEISPVLLTRLVNDVGDNPDQLSILQHALNRTWARWRNEGGKGPLDLKQYEAIGTMAHALDQHAEQAYAQLETGRQQQICELLFKALTDKATDTRGIRRPTTFATLKGLASASDKEVREVIEVFRDPSRSFLMPPAGETLEANTVVDISHESLMRVWKRLKTWTNEEAESVEAYLRLADRARRWKVGDAELLRGRELQRAQEWKRDQDPTAAWGERYDSSFDEAMDYLSASQTAQENRLNQAKRRRLLLRSAVAVVLIVFAGLTFWAVRKSIEAEREKLNAQFKEGLGWLLRAEVAEERGKRYPDTLLYAAQAIGFDGLGRPAGELPQLPRLIRRERDPAARDAYEEARAWIRNRPIYLPVWSSALRKSPVTALTISSDGRWLAVINQDGSVRLWDFASAEAAAMEVSPALANPAKQLVFHPNGKQLAVAEPARVRLWDLESRSFADDEYQGEVSALAYSPSGQILAGAAADGSILLWKGGKPDSIPTKQTVPASALTFSPDDSALAALYPEGALSLFFHQVGEQHRSWSEHAGGVTAVAFGPNGVRLAVGSKNGSVSLWEVGNARLLGEVVPQQRHGNAVLDLSFRHDGKQLASAAADRTIKLWDVTSDVPDLVATLTGHQAEVSQVAYQPGGRLLASASADGSAKLWDVSGRTGEEPPLYPYLAEHWYAFNPSQQAVWQAGAGFLNLPSDSVIGIWQGTQGPRARLFAQFIETKNWAGAAAVAAPGDRQQLAAALLADAQQAAQDFRWNRVRLRLGQLDTLGAAGGSDAAKIREKMATIAVEEINFTNGDGIELVWCPAGSFQMGSPQGEQGRDAKKETQHEVTLTQGFWIGKHEVTQAQYKAVMGDNPSTHQSAPEDAAEETRKNWTRIAPAENMDWHQAMEFCRKLTDRERARGALPSGWEYNLPTEAQWEYACRAGTDSAYSFGEDASELPKYGNFGLETVATGNRYVTPQGSYLPNPWGLFDMHGNVWEWCRDCYDPQNADYPKGPVTDPLVSRGPDRQDRGGSFISSAESCRSAKRDAFQPAYRFSNMGLRAALVRAGASATNRHEP